MRAFGFLGCEFYCKTFLRAVCYPVWGWLHSSIMRKGIAVSPGVAIGTAYLIEEIFVRPDSQKLDPSELETEWARYERAHDRAVGDLEALEKKVASQVGNDEASIFAAHRAILEDPAFNEKIRQGIFQSHFTVASALHQTLNEYTSLFARTRDPYLIERIEDVRDVIIRISGYSSDVVQKEQDALPGPLVLVANELLPSQVAMLGDVEVCGIVTQGGSQTSHAAIIARSKGIPAVSGVRGIVRQIQSGDTVVVDGRTGHVDINPDPESLAAFRKLEREFFLLKDQLAENRQQPAVTRDNRTLRLLANINGVEDARAAVAMGASGVGLYRTEYFYLMHPDVPDEDQQVEHYQRVIQDSPNHQVTLRTLDIGGDKTIPYLGHRHQEANPFMGWRSIRLSFEHPEFFSAQIRAVLRAAADFPEGHVRLMFPMVTTLDEARRLRALVRRSYQQMEIDKKRYGIVPIGMMLEVPAAAVAIDLMLEAVDFVSIGSNDLVQYLMAADRDNPKVSHLCQPLAPAVLRVLQSVIQRCDEAQREVTLCGEMAGQPRAFLALLGMGLRNFSMSPAFVPSIKQLASQIDWAEAVRIANHALQLKTTQSVKSFLGRALEEHAPNLALLDSN